MFLPLRDVQRLLFADQRVLSAVMVRGQLDPHGSHQSLSTFDVLTNDAVRADFDRVLSSTNETIGIVNLLLWLMATGIVAAILFVSVLERTRDFATLKAMGTTNCSLLAGLVVQATIVAVASAVASTRWRRDSVGAQFVAHTNMTCGRAGIRGRTTAYGSDLPGRAESYDEAVDDAGVDPESLRWIARSSVPR